MTFNHYTQGVGDLDQRWAGLAGNGANHCVPASMLNWMYYYARNGRPEALAFPTSYPGHEVMNLAFMGAAMGVTATNGTNSSSAINGLEDWMDARGIPAAVRARRAREGDDITYVALRNQLQAHARVVVTFGRYTVEDGEFKRGTAHAMTLVGLKRNAAGTLTMTTHDPNHAGGDLTSQSEVQPRVFNPVEQSRNIEGDHRRVLRLDGSTNPYRFIDAWLSVVPIYAVTNRSARKLTLYRVDLASGRVGRDGTQDLPLPFPGEVADIALHPVEPLAAVVSSAGEVWTLNLGDGSWLKLPGATAAQRVCWRGRGVQLFVAQKRGIAAFGAEGQALGRLATAGTIEAMSYDMRNDRLIVACGGATAAQRRLLAVTPALTPALTSSLKATGAVPLPALPGKGRLALSVNSRDATLVLSRQGSPEVATLRWLANGALVSGRLALAARADTTALQVSGLGRIYVSEGGKVASFDKDGVRISGSPWMACARGRC
jgi:hypothetical protein